MSSQLEGQAHDDAAAARDPRPSIWETDWSPKPPPAVCPAPPIPKIRPEFSDSGHPELRAPTNPKPPPPVQIRARRLQIHQQNRQTPPTVKRLGSYRYPWCYPFLPTPTRFVGFPCAFDFSRRPWRVSAQEAKKGTVTIRCHIADVVFALANGRCSVESSTRFGTEEPSAPED